MSKIKDAEKLLKKLEKDVEDGFTLSSKNIIEIHRLTFDALQDLIDKLAVHDQEKFK